MRSFLIGLGAGAAVTFLLDPQLGRRRRAMARDRFFALARRAGRRMGRIGRKATSDVAGFGQRISHLSLTNVPAPNDATLKAKVETELFRDPEIPKGRINVNAENRVVVLRGELDRPEQINAIEAKVRSIPGVAAVENLLHLKGTQPRAA